MKQSIASFILISMLVFYSQGVVADSLNGQVSSAEMGKDAGMQTSHVTMNIGVEISGLEKAAEQAAEGLNLIGESLQNLANKPELTPEHHKQIEQTLRRIDELGQSMTLIVGELPTTVEKSMKPVAKVGNKLSSQIKHIVIITSIALILIILVALAAVYYFVLAPGTRSVIKTATLLDELADTLKTTAKIVEVSSERNLQVMEEVRNMQSGS